MANQQRRELPWEPLIDQNVHAPNEKLDLRNVHNGIIASVYLYREIAPLANGH